MDRPPRRIDGKLNPAYMRWYYAQHRREIIDRARAHAIANPDRRKVIEAEYRERNRAACRARNKAMKARRAQAPGTATVEQLQARWDFYGGRCYLCGDPAVEWDHVLPLARGGSDWPSNQRPSCGPCNRSKGVLPVLTFRAKTDVHMVPMVAAH